jgi:hypothetical protein
MSAVCSDFLSVTTYLPSYFESLPEGIVMLAANMTVGNIRLHKD